MPRFDCDCGDEYTVLHSEDDRGMCPDCWNKMATEAREKEQERDLKEIRRKAIRRVIELTAWVEDDGTVWGHDTDRGKIDELISEAEEILGD